MWAIEFLRHPTNHELKFKKSMRCGQIARLSGNVVEKGLL